MDHTDQVVYLNYWTILRQCVPVISWFSFTLSSKFPVRVDRFLISVYLISISLYIQKKKNEVDTCLRCLRWPCDPFRCCAIPRQESVRKTLQWVRQNQVSLRLRRLIHEHRLQPDRWLPSAIRFKPNGQPSLPRLELRQRTKLGRLPHLHLQLLVSPNLESCLRRCHNRLRTRPSLARRCSLPQTTSPRPLPSIP